MRTPRFAFSLLFLLAVSPELVACDSCQSKPKKLSRLELSSALASGIAMPAPAPPPPKQAVDSLGHAANVLPGQGPKRIEFDGPRMGPMFPILPGQGIGPIRFGANVKTIERLMGAPCDEATETLCRYVGRAVEFKLEGGVTKEIKISRKGRSAKRAPDGSVIEYGFFNGAIQPDLYFGMLPQALIEVLGSPRNVEIISPMGEDGFHERHVYDGMTLEYDRWSNGQLVLGAAVLTKSDTAAAANEAADRERAKQAAEAAKQPKRKVRPTTDPR